MEKIIKLIMAILLVLCLAKMPYSYYEFVRFISMLAFGTLAYFSFQNKNNILIIVYLSLALLFQPFSKIALGRELWNIVDVVIAIFLIVTIFIPVKKVD